MNRIIDISRADMAESLRSGLRSSQAHAEFGTDMVRLAFGRHAEGRIRHVSSVERGRECQCFCPACSEALIAKQGEKKAWHFAHASGGNCRDALSASFAGFMAQLICDGEAIALPDLEWTWGASLSRRALPPFVFRTAVVEKIGESGGYAVRARAPGAARDVVILFRTVRGRRGDEVEDGSSVLEIDLMAPIARLLAGSEDVGINEAWATRQLLKDAPRAWLYNAAADAQRARLMHERLSVHVEAAESVETWEDEVGHGPTSAEEDVALLGLSEVMGGPDISGERYLSPGWRAEILRELVIAHLFDPKRGTAPSEIGFSNRDLVRLLAKRKMVRSPALMRPLAPDDAIELGERLPDLRKPIEVIEDYLDWLWEKDVIRARPGLKSGPEVKGVFDNRLAGSRMPDWIVSPEVVSTIRRRNTARA